MPTAITRPTDTCSLKSAPEHARVIQTHGVDFKVWPSRVDGSFTGCQKVWLEDGRLLATTRFEQGQVRSFVSREPGSRSTLRCQYPAAAGRKPLPEKCPAREAFPLWQ